ncbi:MAG: hypothetical protein RR342_03795 [Bacilli bacterium]
MNSTELKLKLDAAEERVAKTEKLLNKYQTKLADAINKVQELKSIGIDLDDARYVAENWNTIIGKHYDIYHLKEDTEGLIKSTERTLKENIQIRDNWKTKYEIELTREEEFNNIPEVIKNFIHEWRVKVENFITEELITYKLNSKRVYSIYENAFRMSGDNRKELMKQYNDEYRKLQNTTSGIVKDVASRGSQGKEYLSKLLDTEEKNKILDLINRVTKFTGKITDASLLTIGDQQGELNGIVIGEDGKCRVNTVGAGGYNQGIIVNERHGQCLHIRVLVKEI